MPSTLSAGEFAAKWQDNARRERASAQTHFNDLCDLLGVQAPNDADPSQDWYCFERAVDKTLGGKGFADVWKRGWFGWEYKGAHADLTAAYRQLLDYREDLENPPTLVVSDMDRIEVHTNFTNTRHRVHEITLDDLAAGGERTAEALRILRAVMVEPEALRPRQTPDEVTQAAASRFADLARSMQERGNHPETVAHFLNRVLFCLFAEDVGLLPRRLMTDLVESCKDDPDEFTNGLGDLFRLMSDRKAGRLFGTQRIEWFNGGLFDDSSVLPFTRDELRTVADASSLDWSQVEPAVLGTLFERGLDPDKRGQLGAHYTDREKILMVVEPVVMTPLRREFAAMQERVAGLMKDRQPSPLTREGKRRANLPKWERDAEAEWRAYLQRLRDVRVLDPACGSGNFLYVTLRLLKDLEQQAIRWGAERLRITGEFPRVDPHNVLGIEINPYAKELAGVAIWIGHIQWMLDHGYGFPRDPVLQPLDNIELRDAILAYDEGGDPIPATWPDAEFVVGNPPFLGNYMLRGLLGDHYVDDLYSTYGEYVPNGCDLVCYWHELSRRQIADGHGKRVGLLATNSIRGGVNRVVLDRIKTTGNIFAAWSDEPWTVDGAAVRVSIVLQDDGTETKIWLDDEEVAEINADLTVAIDLTPAERLSENVSVCFEGDKKAGKFDIPGPLARAMLQEPANVNGRPNSDVVVPRIIAKDVTSRPRDGFIIDFGTEMTEADAAMFASPFAHVQDHVQPARKNNRDKFSREHWWLHQRPRPEMRQAVAPLERFIVTPRHSKHRVFVWQEHPTLADSATSVVARDDDYAFGVLHSRAHELWSLRMGTSLEDRPRYTPTTTFETFPFPWPLNTPDDALTPEQRDHRDAIGAAAKELDEKRRLWLNPPEWVREVPDVIPSLPNRLLAVDDEAAEQLKKRTLTNLYNQRPTWLDNLHRTLDAAVFAAYGWPADIEDEDILERLLALNLERAKRH
ncbi:MAG: class I SAM-dependent DNA methyltransferase [Chloroflexi bacterium]|nr:class I SAM-dependent DNA methyltransferase [Chloroflexota bacterium]MYF22315.1 class I SAM-dependent DNA methyltransferase [Chloroflexota bacterium]